MSEMIQPTSEYNPDFILETYKIEPKTSND